jgi:5-methylthioadenosine/S-adenosylhomocysteine deaminase
VPPLQSLTHDAAWLDSLQDRGFHAGLLDGLARYYD